MNENLNKHETLEHLTYVIRFDADYARMDKKNLRCDIIKVPAGLIKSLLPRLPLIDYDYVNNKWVSLKLVGLFCTFFCF